MKDPIFVYHDSFGPSSRAVLLTISELKLQVKLWPVEVADEVEFIKDSDDGTFSYPLDNSERVSPMIDDNGYTVWESRAVNLYLADRYGINERFYPTDPQKRGLIHRLMFYDLDKMYCKIISYMKSFFTKGCEPDNDIKEGLAELFNTFDNFLDEKVYATGEHMTVADIHFASLISSLESVNYDFSHWPNTVAYMKRLKSLSYWSECNDCAIKRMKEKIKQIMENKNTQDEEDPQTDERND